MTIQVRKLRSIALCAFAMAGTAGAADLRVAPPPPPVFSWSGCYVGGFVGNAWSDGDMTFTDQGNAQFRSYSGGIVAGRVENPHSWNIGSGSSVTAGGTVGCNWQPVGSPFVLGLEGEASYLKLDGSGFDPLRSATRNAITPDVLGTGKVGDWYGMLTGRLGYAWDRTLFYIKGGVAFVQVEASVADACQNVAIGCGNWIIATRNISETRTTWTLGGGVEWAIYNNWSIKGEYMFIGAADGLTTCGFAAGPGGVAVAGGQFCFNHEFPGIHTAKIGLNYRFDVR
jgi:outer membrane immunogenic protein